MWLKLLADGVVVLHLGFIVFVMAGGVLVWRWPRMAWLHLPAAAWGALIEFKGGVCPLTPLENHLRQLAGDAGYGEGFIEHYIMPVVYPSGLTPATQLFLGFAVLAVNTALYGSFIARRRRGDH